MQDPERTLVKASRGLALFGLHQYDVLCEPSTETLVVLGWGGPGCDRVLLSFRGTANMQNVLTDVKVGPRPCPLWLALGGVWRARAAGQ